MTTTASDPNRMHWEATARDEATDWGALATEPDGIDEERVDDPAGLWLRPRDAFARAAVLAIHGGGFISGSAATHRRMFGHLARAAGIATFAIEYGLVPEHVFPSQIETVTNAYRRLLDGGATSVAVLGDSCGAALALAVALRARGSGFAPTCLQVGADESLLDDSKRLADHLRDSGVDVRFDEFAGQLHTFQMAAGRMAVADDAIERAGLWLRSTMSS
jgi:acetyl esterase/lipase